MKQDVESPKDTIIVDYALTLSHIISSHGTAISHQMDDASCIQIRSINCATASQRKTEHRTKAEKNRTAA